MKSDSYKVVKTFDYPGMVVRVHIPDLTEAERAARIQRIQKEAANFLRKVKA